MLLNFIRKIVNRENWRVVIRDSVCFGLGVWLLVRTTDITAVSGLIALVLLGVIPASVFEQFLKQKDQEGEP